MVDHKFLIKVPTVIIYLSFTLTSLLFTQNNNYKFEQRYIKNTNILVTKFYNDNNAFEIIDFMPRYKKENNHYVFPPDIIRYIRYRSGKPVVRFKFDPKLVYAKHETVTEIKEEYIKSLHVFGWTIASALIVLGLDLVQVIEFPVEYAFIVPIANTILYALKEFVADNR